MEFDYMLTGEKIEFPVNYAVVAEELVSSRNEIIIIRTAINQGTLSEIESFLSNPLLYRKALEYSRAKLNYKYMYPVMFEAYIETGEERMYILSMKFKLYSKDDAEEKINKTNYRSIIKYSDKFKKNLCNVRELHSRG